MFAQNVWKAPENDPENDPRTHHHRKKQKTHEEKLKTKNTSHNPMAPKKPAGNHNSGGEGGTPSPGVMGGAALIGAAAGFVISGPLVGVALGAGAALTTLRKDQVIRLGEREGSCAFVQSYVRGCYFHC